MAKFLEFPEGVRLADREEIPGPEPARSAAWERTQKAHIVPGFTLVRSTTDARFSHYAELNVDACKIWAVFCDLCQALLPDSATLIAGEIDLELRQITTAGTSKLLKALGRYQYQLANDGFLQFGLVNDQIDQLTEVFVTPTKHFKVWLNDEARFRSVMEQHDLPEHESMDFIDEYPRVTTRLAGKRGVVVDREELWKDVGDLLGGLIH